MSAYYDAEPPRWARDLDADRYADPEDDGEPSELEHHTPLCRCPDCTEAAIDRLHDERRDDALTGDRP